MHNVGQQNKFLTSEFLDIEEYKIPNSTFKGVTRTLYILQWGRQRETTSSFPPITTIGMTGKPKSNTLSPG